MLVTIISFILILTVLVLIHELGHYLTAKFLGVKVEEFGFGFPPRAIGKKIGETIYSINWLPIGGFVKLYGEDDAGGGRLSLPAKRKEHSAKSGKTLNALSPTLYADASRAFISRPIWQRFAIVFAGVFMNFALSSVLLTYLVGAQGIPVPGNDVYIVDVVKNTPAATAGLVSGEKIISVDNQRITSPEQLINYTKAHEGKQIQLQVVNSKSQLITHNSELITITPRVRYPSNEGAMGIAIGTNVIAKHYPWYLWPFVGLREAFIQSWLILTGLGQLVNQLVTHGQIPQDLAGPVGIAQITGQFVQMGVNPTLSLVALLSLNLAILNVLPIPALDGGRLFFILFEAIFRRKISPRTEGYAHAIGMAVLLLLIVLITFHDIFRIITGQSLIPK